MERLDQLNVYARRVLEEASCKENPSPLLADQIRSSAEFSAFSLWIVSALR